MLSAIKIIGDLISTKAISIESRIEGKILAIVLNNDNSAFQEVSLEDFDAQRLNRYLFEELWRVIFKHPPKLLCHYWVNSGLATGLMFGLAYTNTVNTLWSIFGTTNQLLAALTLIIVSFWLLSKKKRIWFTTIPAIFMIVTTITMLFVLLVTRFIPQGNVTLIIADLVLLGLSSGIVIISIKTLYNYKTGTVQDASIVKT